MSVRKILVPTDFSECAQHATQVALAIAERLKAELHFIHLIPVTEEVFHTPHRATEEQIHASTESGRAEDELNKLIAMAENRGIRAIKDVVHDKGTERIENYAGPLHIDLIVMGSHGVSGLKELVLGSNTERVVKHATVPVLVVKELPEKIDFREIVFGCSFRENTEPCLRFVVNFAKRWNSKINLLYINWVNRLVKQAEAKAQVDKLINLFPGIEFTTSISETNDAEWAIRTFANEIGADLIAVTKKETTGAVKMLSQNLARNLVNHSGKPVLVINA